MLPTDSSTETISALPRSVLWFAPWHWCRHWQPWTRWTLLVVVVLAGYALSPIAAVPLSRRFMAPGPLLTTVHVFYLPLQFAHHNCEAVRWAYETAFAFGDAVVESWAGPVPGMVSTPAPLPPPPPSPGG